MTETFKNCTITYPQSHNNHHILRWYEWGLLVFCKQTPFQLAAIGILMNPFHGDLVVKVFYSSIPQLQNCQNILLIWSLAAK